MPKPQQGFVVLFATFFILIIMFTIAMSMGSLMFHRTVMAAHQVKSTQSYYASESGLEDALLRLRNNPQMSELSYNLAVNGATTNITIPAIIAGARVIVSTGSAMGNVKKNQVVYAIDGEAVSFHYGIQVGEGGLHLENNSQIHGNVFSNGNITGGGNAIVDNDVIVATNHSMSSISVLGNVIAYTCTSASVGQNLTYVTGGVNTCTVQGTTSTQSSQIAAQPLPITPPQIDAWKSEAESGGVSTGDITIANNETLSLSSQKIEGNINLGNNATLNLLGTVHVTGDIIFSSNATVKLDASYGSLSGVIVIDGVVNISNNSVVRGSGQTGSYLLVLSTSSSTSAINIANNSDAAVFYTSAGTISISNNANLKEATGYRIVVGNGASVTYESGLTNSFFSNGPAGGWRVVSWTEQ